MSLRPLLYSSASSAVLASTCRGFRARLDARAPGLVLRLHPHQEAGLSWMRARERSLPLVPDPRWAELRSEHGAPFWVNSVTGAVSADAPPAYPDSPGGLLCDEPGLGKAAQVDIRLTLG